jgi:hypothetical protein
MAPEVVNIEGSRKRRAPGLKREIMEGSLALERVDTARLWRGGMQHPRGPGKNPERIFTLGLRRWSSPTIRNVPIEEQLVLGMLIGGLLVSYPCGSLYTRQIVSVPENGRFDPHLPRTQCYSTCMEGLTLEGGSS